MFWRRLGVAQLLILALSVVVTSGASAHAELLQASPRVDSTVGGEFHSIALQFGGLDTEAPQSVRLHDPAGVEIETVMAREKQRLVLPIEPLTVPGLYTVTYEVNGIDGDFSTGSFSFRFEPGAEPPEGITLVNGAPTKGFDYVGFGLLIAAAAIAAFLVQRFQAAWRDHQRARSAMAAASDAGEPAEPEGPARR